MPHSGDNSRHSALAVASGNPVEPRPEQLALVREAQSARRRVIDAAAAALEECEVARLTPDDTCTLGMLQWPR